MIDQLRFQATVAMISRLACQLTPIRFLICVSGAVAIRCRCQQETLTCPRKGGKLALPLPNIVFRLLLSMMFMDPDSVGIGVSPSTSPHPFFFFLLFKFVWINVLSLRVAYATP